MYIYVITAEKSEKPWEKASKSQIGVYFGRLSDIIFRYQEEE